MSSNSSVRETELDDDDDDSIYELPLLKSQTQIPWGKGVEQLAGASEAFAAATARQSRLQRSFVKVLCKTSVKGWIASFPINFAKKYMPRDRASVLLVDENNTKWKMSWSRPSINCGWKAFATSHGLVLGDACVFQLESSNPLVLRVELFRRRDYRHAPSHRLALKKNETLSEEELEQRSRRRRRARQLTLKKSETSSEENDEEHHRRRHRRRRLASETSSEDEELELEQEHHRPRGTRLATKRVRQEIVPDSCDEDEGELEEDMEQVASGELGVSGITLSLKRAKAIHAQESMSLRLNLAPEKLERVQRLVLGSSKATVLPRSRSSNFELGSGKVLVRVLREVLPLEDAKVF